MASHPEHLHTPEEYLALERKAPFQNEYYAGEIFAMSGASRWHRIIVVNVTTLLSNQLEAKDCEVYANDFFS
jgi:Uma2 family endonuclease